MSPTRFCELDPVQTVILKKCLHVLLTPITKIVNLSLGGGYMPDSLKVSQLAPVLKKVSMDPEDMSSFRPISNLQFISKIIERVVSPQLVDYLMKIKYIQIFNQRLERDIVLKQLSYVFIMIF